MANPELDPMRTMNAQPLEIGEQAALETAKQLQLGMAKQPMPHPKDAPGDVPDIGGEFTVPGSYGNTRILESPPHLGD